MAFLIVSALIICGLPIWVVWYRRHRMDKKHMSQISLQVKNDLIGRGNYAPLDSGIQRLVREEILRRDLTSFILCMGALALAFLVGWLLKIEGAELFYFWIIAAGILLFHIIRQVIEQLRLPKNGLVKIRGFIFRTINDDRISVLYYDMPKMKYRIFSQSLFLKRREQMELGTYVNLIGVRYKKHVRIVRVLSF
ncbi:MAG: hypothetical protein IJ071_05790 [Ruminococcus sp.]|nr:hypothetical protein [Ruminococcus sp.]